MNITGLRRRGKESQIYFEQNRNWLFAIARIKMPMILIIAIAIAIIVTIVTFLFDPVYEAKTSIILDADLNRTLKNVDVSYPYTTQTDYIRYEYFTTHSVTLMHAPQLADRFIKEWKIQDRSGSLLFSEYFIKPNLFRLLFSNDGQGVKADWISDTQQFVIAGYAKDPDTAVAYSRNYTQAFLKDNANNAKGALDIILSRLDSQIHDIRKQREMADEEIRQIKERHRIIDVSTENEALISKIYSIKSDLHSARLNEEAYQLRMEHLRREAANHEILKKYQMTMSSNPMITTLKDKIQELTRTLVEKAVDLTKEHPDYKIAEKKLEVTKEALKRETEKTFYQETDQRADFLDTVFSSMLTYDLSHIIHRAAVDHYQFLLKHHEERLRELIGAQTEMEKINESRTRLATLLTTAMDNYINVGNIIKKPVPFFRVVSSANIDKSNLKYYKYFPKRKLTFGLTLLVSFFALSFMVIAKELHANTLFYGWQVSALEKGIGYADIPFIKRLANQPPGEVGALICNHIHDVLLSLCDARIVRIASGKPEEGKSTVAKAMASYYQKMGQSVVLVDGDVMHRSLTMSVDLDEHPGLTEYIARRNSAEDIVVRDAIPHVSLVPAGNKKAPDIKSCILSPLTDLFVKMTTEYQKIIFVDEPFGRNHHMLADLLPPHDIVVVFKSGEHSICEADRMAEMYLSKKDRATIKAIVVNGIVA